MTVASPARVLLTVVLTVAGPAALSGCATAAGAPERPPVVPRAEAVGDVRPAEVAERSATVEALGVLQRWDARRAAAYAAADAGALRRLYHPASRAGARDVALLRRWAARGGVARDPARDPAGDRVPQVRRVDLVAASARRLVLRVDERWGAAYVVREVSLRRAGGTWRVTTVR